MTIDNLMSWDEIGDATTSSTDRFETVPRVSSRALRLAWSPSGVTFPTPESHLVSWGVGTWDSTALVCIWCTIHYFSDKRSVLSTIPRTYTHV